MSKPEDQSSEKLLPYATGMTYVPPVGAGPGRLLYVQEGNLIAQPFDAERRVIVGEGVTVAESVGVYLDGALFSASSNNILVYRTADPEFPITWFDRQGNVAGRVSAPGRYSSVALSPLGTHAVAALTNPRDSGNSDLWLFDLVRGGNPTRFTYFPAMRADFPLWSFDGKQVLFRFPGPAGLSIFRKDIQSSQDPASVLESTTGLMTPTSWSPDGRFVMYAHTSGPTLWDLFVVALDGNRSDQQARGVPFAPTRFNEEDGRFSPDGEWVAYVSNESGANEIYVRRFNRALTNGSASVGTSVVVSKGGGSSPRWRRDGKELFYLAPGGKMMSVAVALGPELRAQAPVALFQGPADVAFGDATADGQRFLLVERGSAPFTVVLNWMRN